MAAVTVVCNRRRLVGFAEADQIRGQHPVTGLGHQRDHVPVQVGPGWFAVEHENRRGVSRAFVNVVHPETRFYVKMVWSKGVIRKTCEAGFIGSQNTHAIDCPD